MSLVRTVRAADDCWRLWRVAADRSGLSLNAWIVRSLSHVAALEESLARIDESSPRLYGVGPEEGLSSSG